MKCRAYLIRLLDIQFFHKFFLRDGRLIVRITVFVSCESSLLIWGGSVLGNIYIIGNISNMFFYIRHIITFLHNLLMLVISVIIVKQKIFVNNRKEHNALRGEDEVTYMEWKNFYYLLAVEKRIGEMCFIFSDDEKKTEHYLGYTADWDEPYWIGYCDIKDGCGFQTVEELVRASVFDHKNLQERWNKVQIESIDGLTPEEWIQNCYQQK